MVNNGVAQVKPPLSGKEIVIMFKSTLQHSFYKYM